jgi:hypothetical protein
MWLFSRRRREKIEREFVANVIVMREDDKGQILERCADDVERRSLCLQWASEARTSWYAKRREYIARVVASNSVRYESYPIAVRRQIGDQQWGASVEQKDLAALEQMYSRWAQSYAGGPGSGGS